MIKSVTNLLPTVMLTMLKLPNELYLFKADLENNIENTFTILSSYVFRFLTVYILDFSALLHNNHFQIKLVYISLLDYCLCKFLSIYCFCITINFGQNIVSKFSKLINIFRVTLMQIWKSSYMFVFMLKSSLHFRKRQTFQVNNSKICKLRMWNFKGIDFIWTQIWFIFQFCTLAVKIFVLDG